MQISLKPKTFSQFFAAYLKCCLNFKNFRKKDHSYTCGISKITDSEKHGYINVYKVPFQGTFRKGTWYTCPNIVEICMTAPLPYLLIAVKAIDLQKVSFIDRKNLKTVSQHTECQWQVFSS